MMIGFVGSPCSGKSSIAVKLYSSLKEIGLKTELVVEQARQYIAQQRFNNKLLPQEVVSLTDEDQINIYSRQFQMEQMMSYSCGMETLVISDSSCFNTALYTQENFLSTADRPFFKNLTGHYDLIFYCHPIDLRVLPEDPNRIHNLEEMAGINQKSEKLLHIMNSMGVNVKELLGTLTLEQRYLQASNHMMELYTMLVANS